jgi:hypothetical protein
LENAKRVIRFQKKKWKEREKEREEWRKEKSEKQVCDGDLES